MCPVEKVGVWTRSCWVLNKMDQKESYLPCGWNTHLLVRNEDRVVGEGVKEQW